MVCSSYTARICVLGILEVMGVLVLGGAVLVPAGRVDSESMDMVAKFVKKKKVPASVRFVEQINRGTSQGTIDSKET